MRKYRELTKQPLDTKTDIKVQGKDGGIVVGIGVNRNIELVKQLLDAN